MVTSDILLYRYMVELCLRRVHISTYVQPAQLDESASQYYAKLSWALPILSVKVRCHRCSGIAGKLS